MAWTCHLPGMVTVLSFNHSRTEGETFVLLRLFDDLVCIQIETEPYDYNPGKRYKARTIVDDCKKGE